MPKKITATLSYHSEEWCNEVRDTLISEGDNKATDSDVVNYAFEFMVVLEKLLLRTANIDDPVKFIKGVGDGTILIVKK